MIIHLEQCFPLPANKDELHAQIKFVIGELISIDYEFRKQFSPTHCLPIVLTMLFEGEFPFLKAGESNWIWLSSRRVEVFLLCRATISGLGQFLPTAPNWMILNLPSSQGGAREGKRSSRQQTASQLRVTFIL